MCLFVHVCVCVCVHMCVREREKEHTWYVHANTLLHIVGTCTLFVLSGCSDGNETPPQHIVKGGAALSMHLKKWTQRKDVSTLSVGAVPCCMLFTRTVIQV